VVGRGNAHAPARRPIDGRPTATWHAVSQQQRSYLAWIDRELRIPLRIATNFATSFSLTSIILAP